MKDPIHQTIPSDVFCPGRLEADPYAVPNDLQELIRRIQRLENADEVDFVATLWSWWRHQPIPSAHPRVPDHELLRKFLRVRAEVLHIPIKQYQALQAVTYPVFASYPAPVTQAGKVSVRSDILRQMFDFYDQISISRQYPSLEQTNLQARGIGSNVQFLEPTPGDLPKGSYAQWPHLK